MLTETVYIGSITEAHNILGAEKPKHPLFSVIRLGATSGYSSLSKLRFCMDLYIIRLKCEILGGIESSSHDFQIDTFVFIMPNRAFSFQCTHYSDREEDWVILIHPSFIPCSEFKRMIKTYSFFSLNKQILYLSSEQKQNIKCLILKLEDEYEQSIDNYTQEIILTTVSTILKYSQRYYERQFILY